MTKTFELPNGQLYNLSNWFLARIEDVCPKEQEANCYNTGCSWTMLQFCENLSTLTDQPGLMSGDCTTGVNVAYPLDGLPAIGDTVLMRYRGTVDQTYNVFEFVNFGAGNPELAMTAFQCSAGTLSATYSSGCTRQ